MGSRLNLSIGATVMCVLLVTACDPGSAVAPDRSEPPPQAQSDPSTGDDRTSEPSGSPTLEPIAAADSIVDLGSDRTTVLPEGIRSAVGSATAHFAISPDGTRIAFEGDAEDTVSTTGRLIDRLYVANIDGTDVRLATRDPVRAITPSWSPDGTRIVYEGSDSLVEVDGDETITVLDLASGGTTTVFRGRGEVGFPSFAPDGETILFTRRLGYHIDLWAVPSSGGRARIVRRDAALGAYSPDGRALAYRDPGEAFGWLGGAAWAFVPGIAIADVRADGTTEDREQRVDGPRGTSKESWPPTFVGDWEPTRPVWSPDGSRIAYEGKGSSIRVVDVGSGAATTIGLGELPIWLDRDSLIVHGFERGFPSPPRAPFVVGTGQRGGWRWQLSTSLLGGCIAFTDDQGSEVRCISGGPDDMLEGRPKQVFVRVPRPPAPPLAFLFGFVPRVDPRIHVSPGGYRPASTFTAPGGEPGCCYYVSGLSGWKRPYLPEIAVRGRDIEGNRITLPVERPRWAIEPFTTVATVASLHRWRIDVFLDERTGRLCVGRPGEVHACGPARDPVPRWISRWSSFEIVDQTHVTGFGEFISAWGVFRDPVAAIRVQLKDANAVDPGWRTVKPNVYRLPAEFGDPFRLFVVRCACSGARIVALDTDGAVIAEGRI